MGGGASSSFYWVCNLGEISSWNLRSSLEKIQDRGWFLCSLLALKLSDSLTSKQRGQKKTNEDQTIVNSGWELLLVGTSFVTLLLYYSKISVVRSLNLYSYLLFFPPWYYFWKQNTYKKRAPPGFTLSLIPYGCSTIAFSLFKKLCLSTHNIPPPLTILKCIAQWY